MQDKIKIIRDSVIENVSKANSLKEINEIKVNYLGKKGSVNELTSYLKELPNEEKKDFGKLLNDLKTEISNLLEEKIKYYEELELNEKLIMLTEKESI